MDDIHVFNNLNADFLRIVPRYFRDMGLDLERSNSSDLTCNYLECTITIDPNFRVISKHYSKLDYLPKLVPVLPDISNPFPTTIFFHAIIGHFTAYHNVYCAAGNYSRSQFFPRENQLFSVANYSPGPGRSSRL